MVWRLLHLVDNVPVLIDGILSIVLRWFDLVESLKWCLIPWTDILNLGISYECFLWLLAFLIENT
jgi:hypothetical protein